MKTDLRRFNVFPGHLWKSISVRIFVRGVTLQQYTLNGVNWAAGRMRHFWDARGVYHGFAASFEFYYSLKGSPKVLNVAFEGISRIQNSLPSPFSRDLSNNTSLAPSNIGLFWGILYAFLVCETWLPRGREGWEKGDTWCTAWFLSDGGKRRDAVPRNKSTRVRARACTFPAAPLNLLSTDSPTPLSSPPSSRPL